MRRWRLGCLLLVLALSGCDQPPIPACYLPSLALADPAALPGFAVAAQGSTLLITNASAPETTFVLSPDIYSAPWAGRFTLSSRAPALRDPNRQSTLPIRADAVAPLRYARVPNYPDCGPPPADSSAPLTVIQGGERRELTVRITYAYNAAGIADYQAFAAEMESRGKTMTILLGIGVVVLTMVGVGAVYLIVTIISALATLAAKR